MRISSADLQMTMTRSSMDWSIIIAVCVCVCNARFIGPTVPIPSFEIDNRFEHAHTESEISISSEGSEAWQIVFTRKRTYEHLYTVSEFRSRYDRAEFAVGAARVRQSCNNSSLRPWGGEREGKHHRILSRREEKVTRISFRTINETRAKGISSYKSVLRNVVALQRVASVSSIELGRR